jgi:hypothetical protein
MGDGDNAQLVSGDVIDEAVRKPAKEEPTTRPAKR